MTWLKPYCTTDKASEQHCLAYLPVQFSQLLWNKRSIQRVILTCCTTGFTRHTLTTLKKNPNQFRWSIDMDWVEGGERWLIYRGHKKVLQEMMWERRFSSSRTKAAMKVCCGTWFPVTLTQDPKRRMWNIYELWDVAGARLAHIHFYTFLFLFTINQSAATFVTLWPVNLLPIKFSRISPCIIFLKLPVSRIKTTMNECDYKR